MLVIRIGFICVGIGMGKGRGVVPCGTRVGGRYGGAQGTGRVAGGYKGEG